MRKKRSLNNDENSGEISEVNVTPLADVSLTLVIMMMVIAPMVFQSMISVKPSQAVAGRQEKKEKEKPLFVEITPEGFSLNNNPVNSEYDLFRLLQRNLSSRRDRTVLITSAPTVQYAKVVRIMDLVRQSGAANLSLVPHRKGPA